MVPGFPAAALHSPDKDRLAEDNHTSHKDNHTSYKDNHTSYKDNHKDNHGQDKNKHKDNHKLNTSQHKDNKNNHAPEWKQKDNPEKGILDILHNDYKDTHVQEVNFDYSENSVKDIMDETKQHRSQEHNQNMNHKNSQAYKDNHTQDEDHKNTEWINRHYANNHEEKSKDKSLIQPITLDKGRSISDMFDEDFNQSASFFFPTKTGISEGSDESNEDTKPVESVTKSSEASSWLIILLLVTLVILTSPILMFLLFCCLHLIKLLKLKLRSQNQVTPVTCRYDSGHSLSKVQI